MIPTSTHTTILLTSPISASGNNPATDATHAPANRRKPFIVAADVNCDPRSRNNLTGSPIASHVPRPLRTTNTGASDSTQLIAAATNTITVKIMTNTIHAA